MSRGYRAAPANRVPLPPKCCVRCRTPYMCGNPQCRCHIPEALMKRFAASHDWQDRSGQWKRKGEIRG
jgi:hypothetical protein